MLVSGVWLRWKHQSTTLQCMSIKALYFSQMRLFCLCSVFMHSDRRGVNVSRHGCCEVFTVALFHWMSSAFEKCSQILLLCLKVTKPDIRWSYFRDPRCSKYFQFPKASIKTCTALKNKNDNTGHCQSLESNICHIKNKYMALCCQCWFQALTSSMFLSKLKEHWLVLSAP